jgi:hypothetical protein
MDKVIWTDRVKYEALHKVKEERNILHTIKWGKANSIDNIVRRNSFV